MADHRGMETTQQQGTGQGIRYTVAPSLTERDTESFIRESMHRATMLAQDICPDCSYHVDHCHCEEN